MIADAPFASTTSPLTGKRSLRHFLISVVLVLVGTVLVVAYLLLQGRAQSMEQAGHDAMNLARVLDGRLAHTFRRVDAELWRLSHRVDPDELSAPVVPKRREVWASRLARARFNFPEIGHIFIFDATGELRYASDPAVRPLNVGDQPHFADLKAHPDVGVVFSEVTFSMPDGEPTVVAARAIQDEQGRFVGMVGLQLRLGWFEQLADSLEMGENGLVAIRANQGHRLVARFPARSQDVNKAVDSPITRRIEAGETAGVAQFASPIDGIDRLWAFRRLEDYPFNVSVALAASDFLRPWWFRLTVTGMMLSILFSLVLFALWRLHRSERERSKVLRDLRELNRLHRAIEDAITESIWVLSAQGEVISANATALNRIGLRLEDIQGRSAFDFFPEDIRTTRREVTLGVARTGQQAVLEDWRNGINFLIHCYPVKDAQGGCEHIVVVASDVTVLRQREFELAAMKSRLEAIIAGTRAGTWEWNVETGNVIFNERWAEMVGYTLAELAPVTIDTWIRLAHPDDLQRSEALLKRHFAGALSYYECEVRVKHRDGHWVWVLDRGKVSSWTPEGRPLLMSGTHQDISERKQADRALQTLVGERAQLLQLLPVGVYRWRLSSDGKKKFEFVSDRFCEQLGLDRALLLANPQRAFDQIHPEDQTRFLETIDRSIQNLAPSHQVVRVLREGEVRWLEMTSVTEKQGNDVVRTGVQADVTERHLAEQELDAHRYRLEQLVASRTADLEVAKEAAEAASRAKTAFLSIASHELRTPMNGVMGTVALAMKRTTDPKLLDYLEKASRASRQLLAIINDVLEISRIESNRLTLAAKPFELEEIRLHVLDALESIAAEKGVALVYPAATNLANTGFVGDPTRLTQIVVNLVGNALKFTSAGQVTVAVDRTDPGTDRDARLRFEIRDTGIGIRPEDQARIFEPFEQADSSMSRKHGGTGLGLALCRKLTEAMGGKIGLESEPGRGSLFWFEIVLEAVPLQAHRAPDEAAPGDELMNRHRGSNILLVEDEPLNQEIIRVLLEEVGMNVFTAADGLEAIECAQSGAFDLMLMDMNMPNLGGIEATYEIRRIPLHAATPIVALTANAFIEDRDACIQAGMNDHLSKPVMPEILYQTVLRWLDARGHTAHFQ